MYTLNIFLIYSLQLKQVDQDHNQKKNIFIT
jgi:hypothetical protein